MTGTNSHESHAKIAKDVKKKSRVAAKIFSKTGWKAYLLNISLIIHWLEESEPGQAFLAETNGDIAAAICYLFQLQSVGAIKFLYEPSESHTGFWIEAVIPGVLTH